MDTQDKDQKEKKRFFKNEPKSHFKAKQPAIKNEESSSKQKHFTQNLIEEQKQEAPKSGEQKANRDNFKRKWDKPKDSKLQKRPFLKKTPDKNTQNFNAGLKKGVEQNTRAHKATLNPHLKLNLSTDEKVKITPLGGLGEIGGNMTIMETENSAIIIDVGMSFPDENMHGVNILIPDFTYLHQIKHKISGIIITHAHEDHIGAVPYLFKHLQFPLYGTPLALSLVGNKFDEHGLKAYKSMLHVIEKRLPYRIGEFEIEWIHITHSIIDSSALAISTNAGTIIHTGDFKIDHTPIDNLPTDLHRLAYYGEKGVMLLMSDSTNSYKAGITPSEASVGPTFDNLFKSAKGRVIMSTFSSNIHRVYQAIKHGVKYNRKVAVIGRSMEKNLETARELGYIDLPSKIFIEAHEVEKYADSEVLIVTTGSQGESMSALYRMATDEHRHIKIMEGDLIILSAKAIPGNEGSVSTVLNLLIKAGAKVAYQDFSEIHVSGHAAQEEQKLMLRLIKPKFFLPVHGEYNHISKHKQTAISCGILERNIQLMEDGDQIEVNPNYMKKIKSVKSGKVFIDNQANRIIDSIVIQERGILANDGIFTLSFKFDEQERLASDFRFNIVGILSQKEEAFLIKDLIEQLKEKIKDMKAEHLKSSKVMEQELFIFFKKLMFKKFKKNPAIIINAFFAKEQAENRIQQKRYQNSNAKKMPSKDIKKDANKDLHNKKEQIIKEDKKDEVKFSKKKPHLLKEDFFSNDLANKDSINTLKQEEIKEAPDLNEGKKQENGF